MSTRKATKSHLPIPVNFAETPIAAAAWLKINSVTNSIGRPATKPGRKRSTNSGLIHVAPRSAIRDQSLRPKAKSRLAKGLRLVANAPRATGAACTGRCCGGRGRLVKAPRQHAHEDPAGGDHGHRKDHGGEVQLNPRVHDALLRPACEIDDHDGIADAQARQRPRGRV